MINMLCKLDDKRRDLNREPETKAQMKVLELKKSRQVLSRLVYFQIRQNRK